MRNETYLGDGLYASFDGYQIKLRAPRAGGDDVVFLEADVFAAFMRWATTIFSMQMPRKLRTDVIRRAFASGDPRLAEMAGSLPDETYERICLILNSPED